MVFNSIGVWVHEENGVVRIACDVWEKNGSVSERENTHLQRQVGDMIKI